MRVLLVVCFIRLPHLELGTWSHRELHTCLSFFISRHAEAAQQPALGTRSLSMPLPTFYQRLLAKRAAASELSGRIGAPPVTGEASRGPGGGAPRSRSRSPARAPAAAPAPGTPDSPLQAPGIEGANGDSDGHTSVGEEQPTGRSSPAPSRVSSAAPSSVPRELSCVVVHVKKTSPKSFWAKIMQTACASRWANVAKNGLHRALKLDEGCSGLGPATNGCLAIGIPLDGQTNFADVWKDVNRVVCQSYHGTVSRVWESLGHYAWRSGMDHMSGRIVKDDVLDPQHGVWKVEYRRHVWVIGSPCQPWSSQGDPTNIGGCTEHDLFWVTFGDKSNPNAFVGSVLDCLRITLPGVLLFENIPNFCHIDRVSGFHAIREFLRRVKLVVDPLDGNRRYYTVAKVIDMTPDKYIEMSRPRITTP